jgi:hypothetical protein
MTVIASFVVLPLVSACAGGSHGNHTSSGPQATELNDPESWAYQACTDALLAQIKQKHPQVTAVKIDGHMSRQRLTDRKEKLTGSAKYDKGDDFKHLTFECIVDREDKQVEKLEYNQ